LKRFHQNDDGMETQGDTAKVHNRVPFPWTREVNFKETECQETGVPKDLPSLNLHNYGILICRMVRRMDFRRSDDLPIIGIYMYRKDDRLFWKVSE